MSHSVCETLWCSLNSRPIQDTCKRCSHLRTYLLCADCGIIKRDQGVTSRNRRAWAMGTLPNTTTRENGPLAVLCSHCSCCQASSPFAEQELTSRSRPECFARFVFSSCRRLYILVLGDSWTLAWMLRASLVILPRTERLVLICSAVGFCRIPRRGIYLRLVLASAVLSIGCV